MQQLNLDSKRDGDSTRFRDKKLNTYRERLSNAQTVDVSNKFVTESQHMKHNSSALFSKYMASKESNKVIGSRRIPSVDLGMPLLANNRPSTSSFTSKVQSLRYR